MGGIVEHGNTGIAAAGQILSAGLDGIGAGKAAKVQMDAMVQSAKDKRFKMETLKRQLDLQNEEREAAKTFNSLQAKLGNAGHRVAGQDQLYLEDDGSTKIPGFKTTPINFSREEFAAFQRMAPDAQAARLDELEDEREVAKHSAALDWLEDRAAEMLNGEGVYGDETGQARIGEQMRTKLEEAVEAFKQDPNGDIAGAASLLKKISSGILRAQKERRVHRQVGATLFQLHEAALIKGETGLAMGDNEHADHIQNVIEQWSNDEMDDGTALALAGAHPDDIDKILNWGFGEQAKGVRGGYGPHPAPGGGTVVGSIGPDHPRARASSGQGTPPPVQGNPAVAPSSPDLTQNDESMDAPDEGETFTGNPTVEGFQFPPDYTPSKSIFPSLEVFDKGGEVGFAADYSEARTFRLPKGGVDKMFALAQVMRLVKLGELTRDDADGLVEDLAPDSAIDRKAMEYIAAQFIAEHHNPDKGDRSELARMMTDYAKSVQGQKGEESRRLLTTSREVGAAKRAVLKATGKGLRSEEAAAESSRHEFLDDWYKDHLERGEAAIPGWQGLSLAAKMTHLMGGTDPKGEAKRRMDDLVRSKAKAMETPHNPPTKPQRKSLMENAISAAKKGGKDATKASAKKRRKAAERSVNLSYRRMVTSGEPEIPNWKTLSLTEKKAAMAARAEEWPGKRGEGMAKVKRQHGSLNAWYKKRVSLGEDVIPGWDKMILSEKWEALLKNKPAGER